ncbi:FtsK/SpoIIIE domain-containing protein [Mobiluncus mulieris]|uniref:Cell division protein FtsK n=1 Tax=Mobiluncus mulieris TaxID=2052 RepID=A0A7Y0UU36_9ACTO|nr:FtsK/SpoIIIE domain-containing protein [Mobiluncus mulieris]NMX03767.1 cell division protein FtsK [Mobiluncus mulieris]NMX11654.1 cell division protein FtsK [Mobiluncus mulieris]
METFLEPQNALRTPWMWIVQSGPNRGQALPVTPGIFGRLNGFDDSTISRRNLEILPRGKTLRAAPLPDATPVYSMWKTLGFKRRIRRSARLKPGRKLKIGRTLLVIRPRPTDLRLAPPPPVKPGALRWMLFMFLPLVFMLGLGAFIGWRVLVIFVLLAGVALWWFMRRLSNIPKPEHLWLAAATPIRYPAQKTDALRVFTGNRWCRRFLDLPAGENLCLTGPGSQGYAYWLVAQALVFGQGYLSPDNPAPWKGQKRPIADKARGTEDLLEIRVMAPHETPNCTQRQVALTITPTPPAWAQRILAVKARHGRLEDSWFTSLKAAWERNPQTWQLDPPTPGETLPRQVSREILGDTDTAGIIARWRAEKTGLTTPLGITDTDVTWNLDLVKEGPHALVAGTTGAGKSELLTSWLLGLALRYSPAELRFILIDYKGGAAFGELQRLAHVHGMLTDLQPALTRRALLSLEAFLRRREAILATVGARDIDHYRDLTGKRLARVMIVVDEFRALATDHADMMENLIRLATHGRSLGLHLVLATQKPGGIVNAQILANTNLRLALRMRTGADSSDILGDGRAAQLPSIPGRLYWEGQSEGLAQAAWCGADSWVSEVTAQIDTAWQQICAEMSSPSVSLNEVSSPGNADGSTADKSLDNGAILPDKTISETTLPAIWLPPLPAAIPAPPRAFALTDWPRLATQEWRSPECADGRDVFGIFGNPGTGRSTALMTLATNELNRKPDATVLVVTPTPQLFTELATQAGQRIIVFSPRDLWRLNRLRHELVSGGFTDTLVLLDRADLVAEALEHISPGQGVKQLEAMLSSTGIGEYRLAFTAPLAAGRSAWGTLASGRFVLAPRDTVDLHTAGIEPLGSKVSLHEVLPAIPSPGRGVWLAGGTCVEAQIGLPSALVPSPEPAHPDSFDPGFTDIPSLASVLPVLPTHLEPGQIPCSEGLVTLGWASERREWARFTPHRYWQIEESNVMRGLVSQIKREYRRLGYKIVDLESFEPEQKNGKILVFASGNEENRVRLQNVWEMSRKAENFDLTILEMLPPGTFAHSLGYIDKKFTHQTTIILAFNQSVESRHRLASSLGLDLETLRKLQVTTGYPTILKDENGITPLLLPHDKVKHLT